MLLRIGRRRALESWCGARVAQPSDLALLRETSESTLVRTRLPDTVWSEVRERCPERTVDASNETDIRGVVVFVGSTV